MLNTISNVLIQNFSSDLFDSPKGGWLLKVGLPLVLLLLFGEFIPKYLGMVWGPFFSKLATTPFWYIQKIFSPLRKTALAITEFFSYPIIYFLSEPTPSPSDEIEELLSSSGREGILTTREADLLQAFIEIDKRQIKEVLIPRASLPMVNVSLIQSNSFLHSCSESLLVVEEDTENPIGFLNLSEIPYLVSLPPEKRAQDISSFLYVPEIMEIGALTFKLILEDYDVACVVDEYGTVAGIIERATLLDLLFAGQKQISMHPQILHIDHDTITATGLLPIDVINDYFDVSLKSRYHQVTLNGFIAEIVGRIPTKGWKIRVEGLEIRIIERDDKMVEKVTIRRREDIKR